MAKKARPSAAQRIEAQRIAAQRRAAQARIDAATAPGTKNVYIGEVCGHRLVTVHRDPGTTPMFLTCECGEQLHSTGYAPTTLEPVMEWYRPSPDDRSLSAAKREHVALGGVLLRPIERTTE